MSMHTTGLQLILETINSAPTERTSLGAGPETVNFVGTHTRWQASSQNLRSPKKSSWRRVHSGSFPAGTGPIPATSHLSSKLDLELQVQGELYHRDCPGPRQKCNCFDSCSQNALVLGRTQ